MNLRIIPFFLLLSLASYAQEAKRFVHFGTSAHAYTGDLNRSYSQWTGGAYLGIKFNRKEKTNGNLQVGFGKISGNQASLPSTGSLQPNSFFKTNFFSLNYDFQFNILRKDKWRIYASQGIGILRYLPKDELSNKLQDIGDTRADNELYGNIMLILPTQLGAIYFLPNDFGIGAQIGFMNLTGDYIDNISDLGTNSNGDNVLQIRFSVLVPLK